VQAGHSTAAALALEWAAARPERFRAVLRMSLAAHRSATETRDSIPSFSALAWASVVSPRVGKLTCGVMLD